MSCTRAETLQALRRWNAPVSTHTLAQWMGKSRNLVGCNLTALYSRDLCDRDPDPLYRKRYLYRPKQVQA
jgi:predicted transcriptional regulator